MVKYAVKDRNVCKTLIVLLSAHEVHRIVTPKTAVSRLSGDFICLVAEMVRITARDGKF